MTPFIQKKVKEFEETISQLLRYNPKSLLFENKDKLRNYLKALLTEAYEAGKEEGKNCVNCKRVQSEARSSALSEALEIVEEHFKGLIHTPYSRLTKERITSALTQLRDKK